MPGYISGDPLDGMPPVPSLRSARGSAGGSGGSGGGPGSGGPSTSYRPSAASLALTGSAGAGSLASDMMQLEQIVMRISQRIPAMADKAAPFIQQMRDLGAAAMADKLGGGVGATNPDAVAPPPGMAGPAQGQAPGGQAPGGPMMPPPPVLAGMR